MLRNITISNNPATSDDESTSLLQEIKTESISSHATTLVNTIKNIVLENPLQAKALLAQHKEILTSYPDIYQNLEEMVHFHLRMRYDLPVSTKFGNLDSLQNDFIYHLGEHYDALPLDAWDLVLDYYLNFALLRNTEGAFYQQPVIFHHPNYLPVVVDKDVIVTAAAVGEFKDAYITEMNINRRLRPAPLISLLVERMALGPEWHLLQTQFPESDRAATDLKDTTSLYYNSRMIHAVLNKSPATNLSIKLKKLISSQQDSPFVNLHRVIHDETAVWQQARVRNSFSLQALAEMPLTHTARYVNFLTLMTLATMLEHAPQLLHDSRYNSTLSWLKLGVLMGHLGQQYLTNREILESPLLQSSWSKKERLLGSVLISLKYMRALQNFNVNRETFSSLFPMDDKVAAVALSINCLIPIIASGISDACLAKLIMNRKLPAHLDFASLLKDYAPNLLMLLPLMMVEATLSNNGSLYLQNWSALPVPAYIAYPVVVFESIVKMLPFMLASEYVLTQIKNYQNNEPSSYVIEESHRSHRIKQVIGLASTFFLGLCIFENTQNPVLALLASVAMLTQLSLPHAIRTAHLPQRFMPLPKSNAPKAAEFKHVTLQIEESKQMAIGRGHITA